MSHQRKATNRKSSKNPSENDFWQQTQQPLQTASQPSSSNAAIRRPIYPNVPKRTQRISSNNEYQPIQTESQIFIIPSERQSKKPNDCSPLISPTEQNSHTRQTLDLITKYTSPKKRTNHRSLPSIQNQNSIFNTNEPTYKTKSKRNLSPLDEIYQPMHDSKRTKSYEGEEEEDDDELSDFLDHRHNKRILSQSSITTSMSQSTIDVEQKKSTVRKPTARKLSSSQQKPILSQIEQPMFDPPETLTIELDVDPEEDGNQNQLSNHHHPMTNKEPDDRIIESKSTPVKPSSDNCLAPIKQNICFTPVKSHLVTRSPYNSALKRTLENPVDHLSPCLTMEERRCSTTSSASLFYDTPCSSFSRTTTTTSSNSTSTPQSVTKTDHETEIPIPSDIDMLTQFITHMNMNMNDNETKIDYNPVELSKKLFHQSNSFSLNHRFHTMNSLIKKQFLHFGRYEIEILFPMHNDKIPTIYACDICLKHFHGSSIAFQRHTSKCLCTQPPGKLVFDDNDLAIFQIGETTMNMEQRLYMKSLCQITRLFIDSNKSIDDTKIDQFVYYILCRRDPILSQPQSFIYRFIGYFSKQLNQHAQQSVNNLSCLSILPPFAQRKEYNQLLIAFSYFLIRSNASTNLIYSSPARPLDNITLSSLRTYWCDVLFTYIINQNYSSIALDTFSRQTLIHPRDILSSLYSSNFIVSHPIDKSSVYLLNNAYHMMTSFNLQLRNKLLFMDAKRIVTDNENKMMIDKQKINKNHFNGIEEIVLD